MIPLLVAVVVAANAPKKIDLPMPPPPGAAAKPKPAAPAAAVQPPLEKPITMASPKIAGHNLDERAANFYSEQVAARFVIEGFRVTTAREINEMLGLERQRQLLGCSEDSATCMAELANALGVETVLIAEIGKVGASYQLLLKVVESGSAKVLSLHSAKLASEEQLVDEFGRAAEGMAKEVAAKLNRRLVRGAAEVTTSPPPATARDFWWLPVASGVALAGGGVYGLLVADGNFRALERPTAPLTLSAAQQLQRTGQWAETLGIVGVATGAAAVGVGAAMFFLGGPAPAQAVIVPAAGGAFVQVQGVFP